MSDLPDNDGPKKLKIHSVLSSLIQPLSPDEYELLAELSEEERAAFKATLQTVLNHMKQVKDQHKTMG